MEQLFIEITEISDINTRLDKLVSSRYENISRVLAQRLICDGLITVNDSPASKSAKLKIGDKIKILLPEPKPLDIIPQNIPISVIYEDDCLLIVNKPKGLVVHPAPGHYDNTLVNALLYYCQSQNNSGLSSINGVIRPGIVHRIDKDTSGLLIIAKTDEAHNKLALQIKEHSFKREYYAIVHGILSDKTGIIDEPIGRSIKDRKKMCVTDKNAKNAKTKYTVIKEYDKNSKTYSLVKLNLYTGRTHQIRVHMAYIGHSVLGDEVYGKPSKLCSGQCLHAKKIGFIHPKTDEYIEFDSDLPDYFLGVVNKFNQGV